MPGEMPMETRSTSALFKRAEQLRRWQESETNQESSEVSCEKPRRIKFSDGCVFLAACAAGDKEEVERLLALGADINTANVDGLTALHQACIDDNLDMVEFLVEHGCDLNRGDNEGWTPLHATASCGFLSIARYLLENGADVASVNNDGDLPIDIGESGEIEELLQAEINRLGIDSDLVRAQEECRMLEDASRWLNARCLTEQIHPKTGASALHVAAAKGYIKVMGMLVQAGADLNGQDYDGWTPLHAASHWGQKEACQILADNLANMDIKNFAGQTCFDVSDPDMIKLLDELKNKQASMQREHPEIQAILQRPCKVPPPLKRRTSVTRMSGADKSSQVMKDTILERAQIEANLRLEEEEEEDKALKNDVAVIERITEVPNPSLETKEPAEEYKPKTRLEQIAQAAIPTSRIDPSQENEKLRQRDLEAEKPSPVVSPQSSIESPTAVAPPATQAEVPVTRPEPVEKPKLDIRNAVPIGMRIKLKTERLFVPPTRDEESEAQRKAHAKRVRETRRSTQGVTLEDLKSAEQQLLRKQQEEDERKERESDLARRGQDQKPTEVTIPSSLANKISTTTTTPTTSTTPGVAVKAGSPTMAEKRISWRSRSEEKPKDEPKVKEDVKAKDDSKVHKDEPVVLRKPPDTNHILPGSVSIVEASSKASVPSSSAAAASTPASTPLRTRQRPVSAPVETTESKNVPSHNLPVRIRIKSEPQTEGGENEDQDNNEDNRAQGAANQRRRRPKRRSTGVMYIDGEVNINQKPETVDEPQANEKEDKPGTTAAERYRNRYGSSSSLQDGTSTPSRLSERSYGSSPNSSTTSLNEDVELDYKKLYFELKDENERLKKKLSKSEGELESVRQDLQRAQRNMRNSLNDGDKRERRALERKVSELEEELKEFEKIQADNQRLREENGALIRVISKLSK